MMLGHNGVMRLSGHGEQNQQAPRAFDNRPGGSSRIFGHVGNILPQLPRIGGAPAFK
jgi:hypothetical protein